MKKASALIIAVVLAVGGIFLAWNFKLKSDRKARELAAASREISSLKAERNSLKDDMEKYLEAYRAENGREAAFTLFFDSISEELISLAYPLMNEHGFKGTIVLKDGVFPGGDGCISRAEFDLLISKGWDAAIGESKDIDLSAPDAEEALSQYLDRYMGMLRSRSIKVPNVFCFDEGHYDKKFDDVLKSRGFSAIRHYGETGVLGCTVSENGTFLIGTRPIYNGQSTVQKFVIDCYNAKTDLGISVNRVTENENDASACSAEKYTLMLNYIREKCPGALIMTASELIEYQKSNPSAAENASSEYIKKTSETEKRLKEIDDRIEEIYAELEGKFAK